MLPGYVCNVKRGRIYYFAIFAIFLKFVNTPALHVTNVTRKHTKNESART